MSVNQTGSSSDSWEEESSEVLDSVSREFKNRREASGESSETRPPKINIDGDLVAPLVLARVKKSLRESTVGEDRPSWSRQPRKVVSSILTNIIGFGKGLDKTSLYYANRPDRWQNKSGTWRHLNFGERLFKQGFAEPYMFCRNLLGGVKGRFFSKESNDAVDGAKGDLDDSVGDLTRSSKFRFGLPEWATSEKAQKIAKFVGGAVAYSAVGFIAREALTGFGVDSQYVQVVASALTGSTIAVIKEAIARSKDSVSTQSSGGFSQDISLFKKAAKGAFFSVAGGFLLDAILPEIPDEIFEKIKERFNWATSDISIGESDAGIDTQITVDQVDYDPSNFSNGVVNDSLPLQDNTGVMVDTIAPEIFAQVVEIDPNGLMQTLSDSLDVPLTVQNAGGIFLNPGLKDPLLEFVAGLLEINPALFQSQFELVLRMFDIETTFKSISDAAVNPAIPANIRIYLASIIDNGLLTPNGTIDTSKISSLLDSAKSGQGNWRSICDLMNVLPKSVQLSPDVAVRLRL